MPRRWGLRLFHQWRVAANGWHMIKRADMRVDHLSVAVNEIDTALASFRRATKFWQTPFHAQES